MNKDLDRLLGITNNFIVIIDKIVGRFLVANTKKSNAAVKYLHLVLEDQKLILILINEKSTADIVMLVRLQFENFIKGAWLSRCTEKENVGNAINKKEFPVINDLIDYLKSNVDFYEKELAPFGGRSIDNLNENKLSDFKNECVSLLLNSDNEDDHVQLYCDDDFLIKILDLSNVISMLSATEMANVLGLSPEDFTPIHDAYWKLHAV